MQLDVPQNVRMVETATSLETVTAPLGGQEIGVKMVKPLYYTYCKIAMV
jgi:hypothetical protein